MATETPPSLWHVFGIHLSVAIWTKLTLLMTHNMNHVARTPFVLERLQTRGDVLCIAWLSVLSIENRRHGRQSVVATLFALFGLFAFFWSGFGLSVQAAPPPFPPLTTVSGNPRLPGKFVWADLVTDDIPAARRFYAELFGWGFYSVGNYTIAVNADRPLCGMFQRERPKDGVAHPRWFGYISVGSVGKVE